MLFSLVRLTETHTEVYSHTLKADIMSGSETHKLSRSSIIEEANDTAYASLVCPDVMAKEYFTRIGVLYVLFMREMNTLTTEK